MLLVHMLCSLCLFNHYIHVLSMAIVSSLAMRMLFGVRLKCIFECELSLMMTY